MMHHFLYRLIATFFIYLCVVAHAQSGTSLPAEHEATRLMLAVEKSIQDQAWEKANVQLQTLSALEVELPASYHYFNGLVSVQRSDLDQAQKSLEHYVVQEGKDGQHYIAALEQLTRIEEQSKQDTVPTVRQATIKAANESSSNDGYIKSLQALYLTDDPITALVMQINSLLSSHAYTGSRLKKSSQRSGVSYSLAVSESDLLLQEKHFQNGQPELRVNKLNVLGLDPFLKSSCSGTDLMCWIYHPGNGHEYWIMIDRDEMVLNELVEAISKLIRIMQQ